MSRFMEYFQQSLVLQGFLTILLASALVYMLVVGKPVDPILATAFGAIMGYWFGSKKFSPT